MDLEAPLPATTASTVSFVHSAGDGKEVYARYSVSIDDLKECLLTDDFLEWHKIVKSSELELHFLELVHAEPCDDGSCELIVSITVDLPGTKAKETSRKQSSSEKTPMKESGNDVDEGSWSGEMLVSSALLAPAMQQLADMRAGAMSSDESLDMRLIGKWAVQCA